VLAGEIWIFTILDNQVVNGFFLLGARTESANVDRSRHGSPQTASASMDLALMLCYKTRMLLGTCKNRRVCSFRAKGYRNVSWAFLRSEANVARCSSNRSLSLLFS